MDKRRNIEIPGLGHTNPIPLATMIGPFLITGGIPGVDSATGKTGTDFDTQVVLMFQNIRKILEAAGGNVDNILKLTVWMKRGNNKKALNEQWSAMFPNERSRPARHTFFYDDLPLDQEIQCEIQAIIE